MTNVGSTPPIIVTVTADTSTPGKLLVEGTDDHEIAVGTKILKQPIEWHLAKGVTGAFNDLDDPNGPGFSWLGNSPGPLIFTHWELVKGTEIHVDDKNTGGHVWPYKLRATIDNVPYETNPPPPGPKHPTDYKDPKIHNR